MYKIYLHSIEIVITKEYMYFIPHVKTHKGYLMHNSDAMTILIVHSITLVFFLRRGLELSYQKKQETKGSPPFFGN